MQNHTVYKGLLVPYISISTKVDKIVVPMAMEQMKILSLLLWDLAVELPARFILWEVAQKYCLLRQAALEESRQIIPGGCK
ncbi:MAG: hypothetical protein IKK03_12580 [Lachnospiraceae bacterium]|nr:hypothetical protein [Lachnospiraceae bacterium]